MPKIIFITADGARHEVEGENGKSIMETALEHNVPGIVAECNGSAACATCHTYFDEAILGSLGDIDENESDMLDFTAAERKPGSRLSCQVRIEERLDGIIVKIPDAQ